MNINPKYATGLAGLALTGILAGVIFLGSWTIIETGEKGVVLRPSLIVSE